MVAHYPIIETRRSGGSEEYFLLNFDIPEDEVNLVSLVDDQFKEAMNRMALGSLKDNDLPTTGFRLQWEENIGLRAIHIGEGRGAYRGDSPDGKRWCFKNITSSRQAIFVYGALAYYYTALYGRLATPKRIGR
jgi:hypothetical protein